MPQLLKFNPIYRERVWGGHALRERLGRELPAGRPIGESWEIVDRPEAQSVVQQGAWAGQTLRALITMHATEMMGPHWPAQKQFPVLVKWLDCRERLSLQVHPPVHIAAGLGGEPKTENWYFVHTEPQAGVFAGLKHGVTPEQFARAVIAKSVEPLLHRVDVRAGDSLLVPSGVMHAIDAGSVILEIQENSDMTFRTYDWGRMGLDGQPRALHMREALACLAAAPAELACAVRSELRNFMLADCREFRIRRVELATGEKLAFSAGEQPRILSMVAGELLTRDVSLACGENALLPFAGQFELVARRETTVLVTENFAGN